MIVAYFVHHDLRRQLRWSVAAVRSVRAGSASAVRAVAASCWVCAENEPLIWPSSLLHHGCGLIGQGVRWCTTAQLGGAAATGAAPAALVHPSPM